MWRNSAFLEPTSLLTFRQKSPPNHFGQGAEALQHALAVPSETANTDSEVVPELPEDKPLRHRPLASDQRLFLTASASADLQAHVINAVCRNPLRKEEVVSILAPCHVSRFDIYRGRLPFSTEAARPFTAFLSIGQPHQCHSP